MARPRWRLAIVAGALIILSTVGVGLAQAAPAPAVPSASVAEAAPPLLGERLRERVGERGPGRLGRHLVHGTVTFVGRDGELVTLQFDHGTVSAIGDDTVTIAEAGGASETVATTAETRVRKDRKPAKLTDLAVGDEVFVVSVVDGGTATARGIVVPVPVTD
jgi:hypothetical protein